MTSFNIRQSTGPRPYSLGDVTFPDAQGRRLRGDEGDMSPIFRQGEDMLCVPPKKTVSIQFNCKSSTENAPKLRFLSSKIENPHPTPQRLYPRAYSARHWRLRRSSPSLNLQHKSPVRVTVRNRISSRLVVAREGGISGGTSTLGVGNVLYPKFMSRGCWCCVR